MSKGEWIIQLAKLVFALYFVYWSIHLLEDIHILIEQGN